MGILSFQRLNEILKKSKFKNYNTFIETGTYTGRSIIPLAKNFPEIEFHTIEIVRELYSFARKKAESESAKNLNFYLGNSTMLIENIINKIKKDNIIIFLDAHSSSYEGFSAQSIEKDSAESSFIKIKNKFLGKKKIISTNIKFNKLAEEDVPLIKELTIISKLKKNFLVIIDDFDKFEKKYHFADWSNIKEEKIEKIFSNKIKNKFKMPKQNLNTPQLILEVRC